MEEFLKMSETRAVAMRKLSYKVHKKFKTHLFVSGGSKLEYV